MPTEPPDSSAGPDQIQLLPANKPLLPIVGEWREDRQFSSKLQEHRIPALTKAEITTLQINLGKICNQACQHCHVEAGPKRTESMSATTVERVLALVDNSPTLTTVDITGGAPELNPNFLRLVLETRRRGIHTIDRCNLTILLEPGQHELGPFLADNKVEIIASLPCYTRANVDRQRGHGVFEKSIQALHLLNQFCYGVHPDLILNLVYNPLGAALPPSQSDLELDYKRHLLEGFGIRFNHLFTITNMPIKRFQDFLQRTKQQDSYRRLLVDNFNPGTVDRLMCRSLVSVDWEGRLYDCDFNQMLEMPTVPQMTIWEINSFGSVAAHRIATGDHCLGCTAGAGSSCGGVLSR
jgi:radical SAM/Cys-rich protein